MSLKKIMFISGMPGLYQLVAQSRNGFIAESLADKKRSHVSNNQQVSMLSDISIFTTADDVKLAEVFRKMTALDEKLTKIDLNADGSVILSSFEKILPEFDKDRVYTSDIKKVFKWYNLLKDKIDLAATEETTEDAATENTSPIDAEKTEAVEETETKPKAKRKTKKAENDKA
ncbi:MAG: DUF5606 domain-containing protein [Bacteroidia bacterium]|nr:DUF5606 domain-containing protein [Bacteroidia bacterium]